MNNKASIKIHLVLVTKYRKPILTEERMIDCINIIKETLESMYCEVLAIQGDDMNHVHILMKIKPRHCVSLITQRVKQMTTYLIWKKYPELRLDYWYKKHLWSDGYFCCSVGGASEEAIKRYIESQGD